MPFQPSRPSVNPIQLALSIREMRMKQQQAERQFQLDKIAAIGEAKDKEIQRQKSILELQSAMRKSEEEAAPLAEAANDKSLPNAQRQSAADSFINSLNQGIGNRVAAGQDVNTAATTVGANAGGAIAKVRSADAKAIAEKDLDSLRDEKKANRLADKAADRAANSKGDEIVSLSSEAASLRDRAVAADKKKNFRERDVLLRAASTIERVLETKGLSGLSDRAVERVGTVDRLTSEYRETYAMKESLKGLRARPDLLGPQANLAELGRWMTGTVTDLTNFTRRTLGEDVDKYVGTSQYDSFRRLASILESGVDPDTGNKIQEARLLEVQAAWFLLRMSNSSGRVSQQQFNQIFKTIESQNAMTPSNIGLSRVDSVLNRLEDVLWNQRNTLRSKGVEFDPSGELVGDDPLPRLGLRNAPQPTEADAAAATSFEIQPGNRPALSPEEQQFLNQRRGAP